MKIRRLLLPVLAAFLLASCRGVEKPLKYFGDSELNYYKDVATQVDFPVLAEECESEPLSYEPPRRIRHPRKDELWDLGLQEVIHLAMSNSHILRTRGQFLSNTNPLLTNPNQISSVYDPAIQESEVLFGVRGVEAALSDFDARFTTTMLWGRNELVQNNRVLSGGIPVGGSLVEESGVFTSRLEKNFATGGIFAVNHNWNYSGNNVPTRQFQSVYTGLLQVEFRQPLLAAAGVEYSRIAGHPGRNLQGVTGVSQGVLIARINNDISIADFEAGVRNLLKDVEDTYWDLVLAYRVYDIEVSSRNKTLEIWRKVKANFDQNRASAADEAQTRDNYFENRARTENALADLYQIESQLRRLMRLPVNDGRVIRPIEDVAKAEFMPDWQVSLAEALTRRVELRRQKWSIKSLEFQLKAAKSLVRPRFDFVSNYQRNAFGDKLISSSDTDGVTPQGFHSAYETLTQGNQTGWNLGFELSMPLGQREAHAQVRNIELRLAKARSVLSEQEHEISHELANAFQQLDRTYTLAQTNLNRQVAAKKRVDAFIAVFEATKQGQSSVIDPVLRAQISYAQAQIAHYRSLIDYNKAITEINYRKGTLLDHDRVFLSERDWEPEAYKLALRRARSRSFAYDSKLLHTEPAEFVSWGYSPLGEAGDVEGNEVPDPAGMQMLEPIGPETNLSPTPDANWSPQLGPNDGTVAPQPFDNAATVSPFREEARQPAVIDAAPLLDVFEPFDR
jgi:outer membrane protein TolC